MVAVHGLNLEIRNVAVNGLKLEIRNWGDRKRVYELAEALSDMVWHDFDKGNKKVQKHCGLSDNTIFRQHSR
ncbi:MAG: hypothetical protein U9P80_05375, partial [Thermodesulfobacteriota bacterium]|nr:hypothetical protein [Thermodesulfobacteriota bacterium]